LRQEADYDLDADVTKEDRNTWSILHKVVNITGSLVNIAGLNKDFVSSWKNLTHFVSNPIFSLHCFLIVLSFLYNTNRSHWILIEEYFSFDLPEETDAGSAEEQPARDIPVRFAYLSGSVLI
jgi:hypothetical protein